jgi:hypothetical protein
MAVSSGGRAAATPVSAEGQMRKGCGSDRLLVYVVPPISSPLEAFLCVMQEVDDRGSLINREETSIFKYRVSRS